MELLFYIYTFAPIVFITISIVSFIIGLIRKIKNKHYKKLWFTSAVLLVAGIVVFLIMPILTLTFGFGPGLID